MGCLVALDSVSSDNAPNLGPSVPTPTGPMVACRVPGMRSAAKESVLSLLVGIAYSRAVAEETREETPGESLPLFRSNRCRSRVVFGTACSGPTDGAYQHALLILGAPAQVYCRPRSENETASAARVSPPEFLP